MKEYEVTLYFHSNAKVKVFADSEQDALNQARCLDVSEQIQDGLIEEDHDVMERYQVPNGVVLNDGSMNEEDLQLFHEDGNLVLSVGEEIEYEDCKSGELLNLRIKQFMHTSMECELIAADGGSLAIYAIPYKTYLNQLKENGALDAYPAVKL